MLRVCLALVLWHGAVVKLTPICTMFCVHVGEVCGICLLLQRGRSSACAQWCDSSRVRVSIVSGKILFAILSCFIKNKDIVNKDKLTIYHGVLPMGVLSRVHWSGLVDFHLRLIYMGHIFLFVCLQSSVLGIIGMWLFSFSLLCSIERSFLSVGGMLSYQFLFPLPCKQFSNITRATM